MNDSKLTSTQIKFVKFVIEELKELSRMNVHSHIQPNNNVSFGGLSIKFLLNKLNGWITQPELREYDTLTTKILNKILNDQHCYTYYKPSWGGGGFKLTRLEFNHNFKVQK